MSTVQNLIFYGSKIYSSPKIHYNLPKSYGIYFAKMKQLLLTVVENILAIVGYSLFNGSTDWQGGESLRKKFM